jgi:hypothetical protein
MRSQTLILRGKIRGGENRAPDCLSVRLRAAPRGPMTSSRLLTSLKMAAAVTNDLIQENAPKKVRFATVFIEGY